MTANVEGGDKGVLATAAMMGDAMAMMREDYILRWCGGLQMCDWWILHVGAILFLCKTNVYIRLPK